MTVRILQELREGQKAQTAEIRDLRTEMRDDRARADQRFEGIETSLRDLAEQTRAVKVALESRSATEPRLDDHERRLRALENS